jgi:hypothetical protein
METKLTQKIVYDLARGYEAGKTTIELSKEFNLAVATVCRGLRKAGIDPERKDEFFTDKEFTKEERDGIVGDYTANVPIAVIIIKYKTSHGKVIEVLESAGIYEKREQKSPISKVIHIGNNIRRILNLEEQGQLCEQFIDGPLSRPELAKEWGVHQDTVNAILRRHKIGVKRWVPEEIRETFCQEFKDKIFNLYDIAKTYGLDPATVKYWLTKNGVLATTEEEAREVTTKRILTAAEFKRIAREHEVQSLMNLIEIADNPNAELRARIDCNKYVIEISRGKPSEMKAEDEGEEKTATDKIMGMLNTNLFDKKG